MTRSIGHVAAAWMALLAAAVVAVPTTAVVAQSSQPDLSALIETAHSAQDAGEWDAAAEAWSKVAKIAPEEGRAWFNLGYCLHAGGHLEKAIEVHQRAAAFEDFQGIALYNLGCAYSLIGDTEKAFDALEASMAAGFEVTDHAGTDSDLESLRGDPRFAHFTGRSGARGGGSGMGGGGFGAMIHEAFGFVRAFLAENAPKTEDMFKQLVEHAMATLGMLQKELAENPQFAPIAEVIGQFMGGGPQHDQHQMAQGDDHAFGAAHEGAHGDVAYGDAHDTHDTHDVHDAHGADDAHDAHATTRTSEGTDKAHAPLTEAQVREIAMAARRYQQDGEWKKAIDAWSDVVEAQPDIGPAWFGLSYCLHMNGDLEKAIKAHKKAATFEQFEGIATYNLACAYALSGKTDQAFKALKAAHKAGFDVADAMEGDSDLDSLRDDPRFDKLRDSLGGEQ